MKRKKILITGKSGYIARALQLALKDDYEITAIGRADFDLADMDTTDVWFGQRFFDVVIHTASIVPNNRTPDTGIKGVTMDTNFTLFHNIHRNRHRFNRLILFGSGAEFQTPQSEYGKCKEIISRFVDTEPTYFNLRIYGVFDENELPTRFIKANIQRCLNNDDLRITEEKRMDFFYMPDLIALVRFYIEGIAPQKHIDCCYEVHPALCEIAQVIKTLGGQPVRIMTQVGSNGRFRGSDYIGTYSPLPFEPCGLWRGIDEVFQKLKLEHLKNQANIGA